MLDVLREFFEVSPDPIVYLFAFWYASLLVIVLVGLIFIFSSYSDDD